MFLVIIPPYEILLYVVGPQDKDISMHMMIVLGDIISNATLAYVRANDCMCKCILY